MHIFFAMTARLSAQTLGQVVHKVAETAMRSGGSTKLRSADLQDAIGLKGVAVESLSQHTRVCDPPEDVRAGQYVHMGGLAHATRPIKLVGGQVKGGCGVTMIGSLHDSHMPRSWPVCSGYTQC